MSNPKIVAVVPTIRPESMRAFREAWAPLFQKHRVTLVTVWDGESLRVTVDGNDGLPEQEYGAWDVEGYEENRDLFCRRTDACRNLGFVAAAAMGADFVLTLDDDCLPMTDPTLHPSGWEVYNGRRINDSIQAHLDALSLRVPLSWMNTAHMGAEYLRGVPYGVRDEAPVMLSHGVWVGVPDFDGETQLRLEKSGGVPQILPYYVGPVPRGVLVPVCAMNVMIRREMLPYYYLAPMGADSGYPDLHRFGDIWGGVFALKAMWEKGWAAYSGASVVLHQRASDATKNEQQERLGREWNEHLWTDLGNCEGRYCPRWKYFDSYATKRERYADLIRSIQGGK